jgi:hypothetical protein
MRLILEGRCTVRSDEYIKSLRKRKTYRRCDRGAPDRGLIPVILRVTLVETPATFADFVNDAKFRISWVDEILAKAKFDDDEVTGGAASSFFRVASCQFS